MKFELNITPEEAKQLQASLDHYRAIASQESLDYIKGSEAQVFHRNSSELMTALSTELTRQQGSPSFSIDEQGGNTSELRSPYGIWHRDTDQVNAIRSAFVTYPGLAETLSHDGPMYRTTDEREHYADVPKEIWSEQKGVLQIVASDMDFPTELNRKDLSFAELQQPDGITSSRRYTEQQSIQPNRIQKALESRGFGNESTYEYTASNRLAVRLSQAEDRVKVERIYSDGSSGVVYDSHRNDSPSPSLYVTFDGAERQATMEALGTLENVKAIDDLDQERPPTAEFLQAFAQGIDRLKQTNNMGLDPETGEPIPGGGAKERVERNLQALKDITEESSQLRDEAADRADYYWGSSKSENILGSLSGQYQDRASAATEYLEILTESAAQKPFDPELSALFDNVQGGDIERLESSASAVSDYLFAKDTARTLQTPTIIDPTAGSSRQGIGGDDLVNFIDNADFYSQVYAHTQENGVELDGQKAFNFGQGISSAIEGDILTLERYGEPLGSSAGISSKGEVLAIRGDKTTPGIRQSVEASITGYNQAKATIREPLENDYNNLYIRSNELLDKAGRDYVDVKGKTDNPKGSDIDLQIGRNSAGEIEITEGSMPDQTRVYDSHTRALGKSYPSPNFNHNVSEDLVTRLDSILDGEVDLNTPSEWQLYNERSQHGTFKPQDKSVNLSFRDHGQVGHSSLTLKHQGLEAEIVIGLNGSEAVSYPNFDTGPEIEDLIQSERFEELVNASFRSEGFEYQHYPEFNEMSKDYGWNDHVDEELRDLGNDYASLELPGFIMDQLHEERQKSYEVIVGDYVPVDVASYLDRGATESQDLTDHAKNYMGSRERINNQMEMTLPASGDRKELTIIQDREDITIRQAASPEQNRAFNTIYSSKGDGDLFDRVDYQLSPEQEVDLTLALQGEPNQGLSMDNPEVAVSRSAELDDVYQQVDIGLAQGEPATDHGYWSDTARQNLLDGLPSGDQLEAAGELDYLQALATKANELPYSEETMQAFLAVGGDTIEELQESIDKVKEPEVVVIDQSLSSKAELNDFFVKAYDHVAEFGEVNPGDPVITTALDSGVEIHADTSEGEVWLETDEEHLGSADMPIMSDSPDYEIIGFGRIENDGLTSELKASIEQSMDAMSRHHEVSDRSQGGDGLGKSEDVEQASMFDLVGDVMGSDYQPEPAEPDFIDGMDAVIARDMYGTSVEVEGSPQAVAENENVRFFKVVHAATESRGDFDPGTGIKKLDLGQGLTAMVEDQDMIVTQSDGQGNERLIYEQSAETAHLGGMGAAHSDRIEQAVKNTVWSKVVDDNAAIRSRVAAQRSKTEMRPTPVQDKRAARLNRSQQTRSSRSKRSDGQMEFGI